MRKIFLPFPETCLLFHFQMCSILIHPEINYILLFFCSASQQPCCNVRPSRAVAPISSHVKPKVLSDLSRALHYLALLTLTLPSSQGPVHLYHSKGTRPTSTSEVYMESLAWNSPPPLARGQNFCTSHLLISAVPALIAHCISLSSFLPLCLISSATPDCSAPFCTPCVVSGKPHHSWSNSSFHHFCWFNLGFLISSKEGWK